LDDPKVYRHHISDIDKDGDKDLVLHIKTQETGLRAVASGMKMVAVGITTAVLSFLFSGI
jgi:hypothetical protein